MAIIVSRNGRVDYCFMSETMRSLKEIAWLRKGTLIPSDTVTESIMDKSEEEQREVRAEGEVDYHDLVWRSKVSHRMGGSNRTWKLWACINGSQMS